MFNFLTKKFSSIFTTLSGNSKLTQKNIQESLQKVEEALLEADVPFELVKEFIADVKNEVLGQKVLEALKPGEQFTKVVFDRIKAFMGGEQAVPFKFELPSIVMVMGLQGSGKTTSLSKLAHWITEQARQKNKTRKILLASVDFYRPAAVDQLEVLANKVGVQFYRSQEINPVQAAKDIANHYKQNSFELLLLDTAGRLHVDNAMLQELRDIDQSVQPKYKLLVLDAMTGQESLNVAKAFESGVGFDFAMLTKMDSDSRGGAAFSFRYALKKPIRFVGVGEKPEDFELFHPDRMASRMLDMGDVLSLAEKAEAKIKKSEQESIEKSFKSGNFTLHDFASQMDMMNRLGSMSQLMKYIPGMGSVSPDMLQKGEVEMKMFRAIISSMTPKERVMPRLLDKSRKKRIAGGAGVAVADVNTLLTRFEQSKQYVKLFKKMSQFKNFFK